MTIYLLDKDYYVLRNYETIFQDIKPQFNIKLFTNAVMLWSAFKDEQPDMVFVEKDSYDSLGLIQKMRSVNPRQTVVLVVDSSTFTPEMIDIGVDGILREPVTKEAVEGMINKIRHPLLSKIMIKK